MMVRGEPSPLSIQLGDLAITQDVIWLGARSRGRGRRGAKQIEEKKAEEKRRRGGSGRRKAKERSPPRKHHGEAEAGKPPAS